jgi:glutathione synthase
VADAIARPHLYVMKPQREGGGNNVYGPAIAAALAPPSDGGLQPHERAAFILMQRIFPRPRPTWLVRFGGVDRVAAVSELGVYSVFLGDGGSGAASGSAPALPLVNALAGHLLRTKVEGTDEGGVAAGFAVLDSPMLVLGE